MPAHPLARLRTKLYTFSNSARLYYYRSIWGMHIGDGTRISLKAKLDKTNPKGIYIGRYTIITLDAVILSHDFVHGKHVDTRIGDCCFIGCGAIILPGVTIGDHCIIGAGSVVREDVPSHSIAVGNPARIVRTGIKTTSWGILV